MGFYDTIFISIILYIFLFSLLYQERDFLCMNPELKKMHCSFFSVPDKVLTSLYKYRREDKHALYQGQSKWYHHFKSTDNFKSVL